MAKKDENQTASKRRAQTPKSPGRNRRIVHLLLMFVAMAIVVDSLVGDRGLVAILRARHEFEELSASVARQRAENSKLRDMVQRLREDPATIEEIARRELGLIRPGERVFILKDVQPAKP